MPDIADSSLSDAVMEILADGPLPIAEVLAHLDKRGLLDHLRAEGVPDDDLEAAMLDEVFDTHGLWATPERTLARSDLLVDGMVLTHRLTEQEVAAGAVAVTPDLAVLDWNDRGQLELAGGGGRLRWVFGMSRLGHDDSTFAGPAGWLEGFAPGDLLAFRRRGGGVSLERLDSIPDDGAEVALLAAAADGRLREGEGEEALPLLMDALTNSAGAFRRPTRPVGELLEAAGLERRGFSFGRQGEAWQSLGDRLLDARRRRVIDRWHLEPCCASALGVVSDAFTALPDDDWERVRRGRGRHRRGRRRAGARRRRSGVRVARAR